MYSKLDMTEYTHTDFYPDEAFDSTESLTETLEVGGDNSSVLSAHWRLVEQLHLARQEVISRYGGKWDAAQEHRLASSIQDGLSAEAIATEMAEDYAGELDDVIVRGREAKQDLIVANLPYAAYLARISTGLRQDSPSEVPGVAYTDNAYMGKLKGVGAFTSIANLRTEHASLEDRTQVAIEAMWHVADRFCSDPEKGHTAKFVTYATWYMQRQLIRCAAQEATGWGATDDLVQRYRSALHDEELYGTAPTMRHESGDGSRHKGMHPTQFFEGRKSVPLDTVSVESDEADHLEQPMRLRLHEVTAAPQTSVYDYVANDLRDEQVQAVLDVLSDREAGVIEQRFGLDDGSDPKSLREIGEALGVSKERVREIESRTLRLLRHPSLSEVLYDYLYVAEDDSATPLALAVLVRGAEHIKTQRVDAAGGHQLTNVTFELHAEDE